METKTAVEWLSDRIQSDKIFSFKNVIEKAKEKEKEQTIEFLRWFDMQSPIVKSKYTFTELYEKFYQETYKQD